MKSFSTTTALSTTLSLCGLTLFHGSGAVQAGPTSIEDGEFLVRAAMVAQQEVADARQAAQTTQHPEIQQAARSIAGDHLRAARKVADLAKGKGMTMTPQNVASSGLDSQSDPERIATLLKAHEEAVALFHQEAVRGMDHDVQLFAQTTLLTLQRRLATLRSLQDLYPAGPGVG